MKLNKTLIFIFFCIISCTKKAEKSIFIIPRNYQGAILEFMKSHALVNQNIMKKEHEYMNAFFRLLGTEFKSNYGTTTEPEYYYRDLEYN
jgi:hypothetical protein